MSLVLQEPEAWRQHYGIYVIKNTTKKIGSKFFNIADLKTGHPVTVDDYVLGRVEKLRVISNKARVTQEELRILCETDHNMGVHKNTLIEGNGRFTALKLAGFNGLVELDYYDA